LLGGEALATLHYDIGSDPRTGRPALQATIDLRSLASGRHLLRVARAPASVRRTIATTPTSLRSGADSEPTAEGMRSHLSLPTRPGGRCL
jgi:hypothetical protein